METSARTRNALLTALGVLVALGCVVAVAARRLDSRLGGSAARYARADALIGHPLRALPAIALIARRRMLPSIRSPVLQRKVEAQTGERDRPAPPAAWDRCCVLVVVAGALTAGNGKFEGHQAPTAARGEPTRPSAPGRNRSDDSHQSWAADGGLPYEPGRCRLGPSHRSTLAPTRLLAVGAWCWYCGRARARGEADARGSPATGLAAAVARASRQCRRPPAPGAGSRRRGDRQPTPGSKRIARRARQLPRQASRGAARVPRPHAQRGSPCPTLERHCAAHPTCSKGLSSRSMRGDRDEGTRYRRSRGPRRPARRERARREKAGVARSGRSASRRRRGMRACPLVATTFKDLRSWPEADAPRRGRVRRSLASDSLGRPGVALARARRGRGRARQDPPRGRADGARRAAARSRRDAGRQAAILADPLAGPRRLRRRSQLPAKETRPYQLGGALRRTSRRGPAG